jgi:hypothetical protein
VKGHGLIVRGSSQVANDSARMSPIQRRESVDDALARAIEAVRSLDVPHLEVEDERAPDEWLH